MGALNAKIIEDEPKVCNQCGEKTVWTVYAANCQPCRALNYIMFRHAMDWPLDDEDKRALGLVP